MIRIGCSGWNYRHWRGRSNPERRADFLALLPRDIVHVFESPDPSWMTAEILALLDSAQASFCVHDMAGEVTPRWAAGRAAYVRFHGTGGKYVGRYSEVALRDWAGWLAEQQAEGRQVWAYFNTISRRTRSRTQRRSRRCWGRTDLPQRMDQAVFCVDAV